MGRVEELPISVRLALPVHVVLVSPCLPEVQHQQHCYFLDCPRKFRLRPLLCFHNMFTRVITLSKGGWKTRSRQLWVYWGPTHYIYRTDMISYPPPSNVESLRYASTSGQIQHMWNWCPKLFNLQCGLDIVAVGLRPSNEQHKHISVIMRITRVPNSAAISRADIIVMSASPRGPHHRYNFIGDSFSKVYVDYKCTHSPPRVVLDSLFETSYYICVLTVLLWICRFAKREWAILQWIKHNLNKGDIFWRNRMNWTYMLFLVM